MCVLIRHTFWESLVKLCGTKLRCPTVLGIFFQTNVIISEITDRQIFLELSETCLYMVHLSSGPFSGSCKHSGNIGLLKSNPKMTVITSYKAQSSCTAEKEWQKNNFNVFFYIIFRKCCNLKILLSFFFMLYFYYLFYKGSLKQTFLFFMFFCFIMIILIFLFLFYFFLLVLNCRISFKLLNFHSHDFYVLVFFCCSFFSSSNRMNLVNFSLDFL